MSVSTSDQRPDSCIHPVEDKRKLHACILVTLWNWLMIDVNGRREFMYSTLKVWNEGFLVVILVT